MTVWDEAAAERKRAVKLHRDKSMDAYPNDHLARLAILMEEVGEVAKEFCDAAIYNDDVDLAALRTELIQVCAMSGAWADAIRL